MIDQPLSAWFHENPHPDVTRFLLFITHWHGTIGVLLMSAALGFALWRWGRRWWLLALVLSVPGGMLLNVAVKHLVQRARPHFDDPLVVLTTYSFPSGHTAGAALFYGFLAVLVYAHPRAQRWRAPMVAVGALMVLLVGLSRVYLGAHFFTDVVGGLGLAALWLCACLYAVQALRRRRGGDALHG